MTLKEKIKQLNSLWTSLQTKIKNRLEQDSKTITETNAKLNEKQSVLLGLQSKLNETNHKLELQMKENSENVKVLEQLEKEFEEVSKELDN
jgi:RNAse (barnase) inhibitor barstar